MSHNIKYKFNEDDLINELKTYIDKTYSEHYACDGQIQSLEVIFDRGHGPGFCHGNIDKYNGRYGKKEGYNRKDLQKILHYALLALYLHDKNYPNETTALDDGWINHDYLKHDSSYPPESVNHKKVDYVLANGKMFNNALADTLIWDNQGECTIVKYRLSNK